MTSFNLNCMDVHDVALLADRLRVLSLVMDSISAFDAQPLLSIAPGQLATITFCNPLLTADPDDIAPEMGVAAGTEPETTETEPAPEEVQYIEVIGFPEPETTEPEAQEEPEPEPEPELAAAPADRPRVPKDPLTAHLLEHIGLGGWTLAQDIELLELLELEWTVNEIALETRMLAADVKKRFELLTDKRGAKYPRDMVLARLKMLSGKAA